MNVISFSVLVKDYYPEIGIDRIGGNSINFAIQSKLSGASKVAVLGAVGNDRSGKEIKDFLSDKNIEHSRVNHQDGKTATNQLLIDESGERYSKPGSWDGGVYDTYRIPDNDWAYINTFDIVGLVAYDGNFKRALNKLRSCMKISVDFLHMPEFDLLDRYSSRIDIAFFGGDKSFIQPVGKLAEKLNMPIVITLGKDGSCGFFEGKQYNVPPPPVKKVTDTTGCGDSFQAACALSWFRNQDLKSAMDEGTAAAAKITGHYGGAGYMPHDP